MSKNSFVNYIVDILSEVSNIRVRSMFGGYGIYCDKIIFAIIINDDLYFKADESLSEEFNIFGSFPFTYKRYDKIIAMRYWYVPAEVIENIDLLKDWFSKSFRVAKLTKLNKYIK